MTRERLEVQFCRFNGKYAIQQMPNGTVQSARNIDEVLGHIGYLQKKNGKPRKKEYIELINLKPEEVRTISRFCNGYNYKIIERPV